MRFDIRPVGLFTRLGAVLAVCLTAPVVPWTAGASTFAYQSQTGTVSASGGTPTLGSASQTFPISGLGNVDQVALVEAGDPEATPTDYYRGRAALQTALGSDRLQILGDASGEVGGCDPLEPVLCTARGDTDVTIAFDLETPQVLRLTVSQLAGTHNGPEVWLRSLDLGFTLYVDPFGDFHLECGSLPENECFDLPHVFGPGVALPAGSYEIAFLVYGFVSQSFSCAVGCGNAGGSATLEVVPPEIAVDVDVKPSSETNPVNLFSRVLIPVAILGSEVLDVADVDVATLHFEGAAPVHAEGGHLEDVDDDAFTDLLSHYAAPDTTIAFGQTEACVTGELLDGTPFKGCDAIVTVPPCGIGFELALLLPPLMWLHRRRRA